MKIARCRPAAAGKKAVVVYLVYLYALRPGLGWVDFDFSCFTICTVLLRLMGIRQKRLCSWAIWWNTQIKVNLTQVHEQMGHPVVSMNNFVHKIKGHRPGTLPLAPILPKLISCPVQRR